MYRSLGTRGQQSRWGFPHTQIFRGETQKMKKNLVAIGTALVFVAAAAAADAPKTETFLGYTYMRANSATNVPAFSANGGGGQFVYNFSNSIGAVADLSAVHNGNIGGAQL